MWGLHNAYEWIRLWACRDGCVCRHQRMALGSYSLPALWVPGIELRSSGMHLKCLYLLSHPSHTGYIVIFFFFLFKWNHNLGIVDFPYNPVNYFKVVNDPISKIWRPKAQKLVKAQQQRLGMRKGWRSRALNQRPVHRVGIANSATLVTQLCMFSTVSGGERRSIQRRDVSTEDIYVQCPLSLSPLKSWT